MWHEVAWDPGIMGAGLVVGWIKNLVLGSWPGAEPSREPGFVETLGKPEATGTTQGHRRWLVLVCAKRLD